METNNYHDRPEADLGMAISGISVPMTGGDGLNVPLWRRPVTTLPRRPYVVFGVASPSLNLSMNGEGVCGTFAHRWLRFSSLEHVGGGLTSSYRSLV